MCRSSHNRIKTKAIKMVFDASTRTVNAVLMSKSKNWLVRNQDNEYSEWSDMITHGLLLQ